MIPELIFGDGIFYQGLDEYVQVIKVIIFIVIEFILFYLIFSCPILMYQ